MRYSVRRLFGGTELSTPHVMTMRHKGSVNEGLRQATDLATLDSKTHVPAAMLR